MRKILVLFILSILPLLCYAQKFTVKVVGVSDGDTFTGLNRDNLQLKIRVYGIDAPEKKQDFGNKSKEYLSSLIFGQEITVDVQSQDGFGRFVSHVYTTDGKDVSLLMLQAGMGWHYKQYDQTPSYSEAEASAKKKKIGLWQDMIPIAPWDYRKK